MEKWTPVLSLFLHGAQTAFGHVLTTSSILIMFPQRHCSCFQDGEIEAQTK